MHNMDEFYATIRQSKQQMFQYNKNDIEDYYDGKTYIDLDEAYASLYKNALLERHYIRKL